MFDDEHLDESVLEDIKVKTCFVTTYQRGSYLAQQKCDNSGDLASSSCPIKNPPPNILFHLNGNQILTIPGDLRESVCEVMFEMYGEEHTLPTLIIDLILKCPRDVRKQLASNIVLIGGTAMLAGFKHRLVEELIHLSTNSQRYQSKALSFTNDFKVHALPCKANVASWLGASIFASSELLAMRSVTYEQFVKNNCKIADWSEWIGGKSVWIKMNGLILFQLFVAFLYHDETKLIMFEVDS